MKATSRGQARLQRRRPRRPRSSSGSPSPSPEYCEDDYQEVRKCPFLEELVHNSDAETTLDGVGSYKENT